MNDHEEHSAPPAAVPEKNSGDPSTQAALSPDQKPNVAAPVPPAAPNGTAAEAKPAPETSTSTSPTKGATIYDTAPTASPAAPAPTMPHSASDVSTGELRQPSDPLPTALKSQDNIQVNSSDSGRDTLFVSSPTPTLPVTKSAGETCPKCGHLNRAGILVCEKCGTLLIGDEHAGGTKRFEGEKKAASASAQPVVIETTELFTSAITSAGSSQFTENMVLRLEIEGAPTPILVHPKIEMSLGRRDPATGTMPDVDLSTYAGYRLGVSRKHAIIRLKNRQLELYDLGSSNGTSVNGTRLVPHQAQVLRDGDEVMLGKMTMRMLFQVRSRH